MKRLERLGETTAPDGTVLTLYRHDRDHSIRVAGVELMSTRRYHSEEQLAELVCRPLQGGVLVPVSAWTLLRRVPFGLVFAGASLGTASGGTLGLLLSGLDPFMAVGGAVGGYLLSAAYLYRRSRGS